MKVLLDMVATEAIEYGGMSEDEYRKRGCPLLETSGNKTDLPPIRVDLELLCGEDGKLYWVE